MIVPRSQEKKVSVSLAMAERAELLCKSLGNLLHLLHCLGLPTNI